MGKIVFITGATSGFGRAAARRFVEAGWKVIATGRRADRLDALREELGDALHPAVFDIRDEAAMRAALDARQTVGINQAMAALNEASGDFAARRMDRNIRRALTGQKISEL